MTKVQINFIDPTKKIKNVMLPLINNNYNEDSLLAQNHAIPCHYVIACFTRFGAWRIFFFIKFWFEFRVETEAWTRCILFELCRDTWKKIGHFLEVRWRHESKRAHNKIGHLNLGMICSLHYIVNNTCNGTFSFELRIWLSYNTVLRDHYVWSSHTS